MVVSEPKLSRWYVLHFTPSQLVVGHVDVVDAEGSFDPKPAPFAVIPALKPHSGREPIGSDNRESGLTDVSKGTVDPVTIKCNDAGIMSGAIVWRKFILDRRAFFHLLTEVFQNVLVSSDRSSSGVAMVWKDGIDADTETFIKDTVETRLGFRKCLIVNESRSLMAYHSAMWPRGNGLVDESIDEDPEEPRSIAEYIVTASSGSQGVHIPALNISEVPVCVPANAGTVIHMSEDSLMVFAFAHNSIVGRVRVSEYGSKAIEMLCDRLSGSTISNCPSSYRVAHSEQALTEQLTILKRQFPPENLNDGGRSEQLKPKHGSLPKWFPFAAGELLLDPHLIPSFFTFPVELQDDSMLSLFKRKPSLLSIVKDVSHDNVPFDLADILLRCIFVSGSGCSINGFPQRIASSLQAVRADEMRQSKAANKERKGGRSMAASWALSQLEISQLQQALMDVEIQVYSPIDVGDAILVPWRGACLLVQNMMMTGTFPC